SVSQKWSRFAATTSWGLSPGTCVAVFHPCSCLTTLKAVVPALYAKLYGSFARRSPFEARWPHAVGPLFKRHRCDRARVRPLSWIVYNTLVRLIIGARTAILAGFFRAKDASRIIQQTICLQHSS